MRRAGSSLDRRQHPAPTPIANIGAALQHVRAAAEQFKSIDPWTLLLRYISDKIAPSLGPFRPADRLPATG